MRSSPRKEKEKSPLGLVGLLPWGRRERAL